MLPHVSGSIYTMPSVASGITNLTLTAGRLYLLPWVAPLSGDYNAISAYQTTAAAANYHLGIYGPFTGAITGCPLLLDSGPIALSTSGLISAPITVTLEAAWYLLALLSDSARSVRAFASTQPLSQFGYATADDLNTPIVMDYAMSYGALPSSLPASPAYLSGVSTPRIGLTKS